MLLLTNQQRATGNLIMVFAPSTDELARTPPSAARPPRLLLGANCSSVASETTSCIFTCRPPGGAEKQTRKMAAASRFMTLDVDHFIAA